MKRLFQVLKEEEGCRCNTHKLEWRLTTTVESQFWDTKDVLSPRVQLYTVLKAAATSIQLWILSIYSNQGWKSEARHWKSDHREDVELKWFDSMAETSKKLFFQTDPRAEPSWAGVLWGNCISSVSKGSILCWGGVWEEEDLRSHRLLSISENKLGE